MKAEIKIDNIAQAKSFVELCGRQSFSVDVKAGHYICDGKSILGVLGLDLNNPLKLEIYGGEGDRYGDFVQERELLGY